MGASFFDCDITKDCVSSETDAFNTLRENALYEYGHGGYTGTIAEKATFIKLGTVPTYNDAVELGFAIMDADCPLVIDKWGDAGMIEYDTGYYFFGLAST